MTSPAGSDRNRVIVRLQQGIPLVQRPFRTLAREIGLAEPHVLRLLSETFESGQARRFGGLFDSRSLGFRTTLCMAAVPQDRLDAVGGRLRDRVSVTHAYARIPLECLDHPDQTDLPALWFTVNAQAPQFDKETDHLRRLVAPWELRSLPAMTSYKIGVILDPEAGTATFSQTTQQPATSPTQPAVRLDRQIDRLLLSSLQGSLPISPTPFSDLARNCGVRPDALLQKLRRWQAAGALRRVGLVLRHRHAGFRANAMCVWPVPAEQVDRAGRDVGALNYVTHCYRRPRQACFPFDLYAMIHGRNWRQIRCMFEEISVEQSLPRGRVLCSVREYRKASPRYVP